MPQSTLISVMSSLKLRKSSNSSNKKVSKLTSPAKPSLLMCSVTYYSFPSYFIDSTLNFRDTFYLKFSSCSFEGTKNQKLIELVICPEGQIFTWCNHCNVDTFMWFSWMQNENAGSKLMRTSTFWGHTLWSSNVEHMKEWNCMTKGNAVIHVCNLMSMKTSTKWVLLKIMRKWSSSTCILVISIADCTEY